MRKINTVGIIANLLSAIALVIGLWTTPLYTVDLDQMNHGLPQCDEPNSHFKKPPTYAGGFFISSNGRRLSVAVSSEG
ncbi:hypothetical protein DSM101010T_23810 [Desulfovibrio subterraneus]|uniref:Uncharacterized protein n=1 Tax=Desulfovibrio subterraneus TaxID=2718620 RepID=A0A7J0BJY1_9BACT|nr:hypothetical protein DSM101010T_23810 [Desulfovibrio subterraneus]